MLALALVALVAAPAADANAAAPVLRELLLKNLPTPLIQTSHDWGRTAEVVTGVAVRRRGFLKWDAEPRKERRNDGHWYKTAVTAKDPARTLSLTLGEVTTPEPGVSQFTAVLASDVDLAFEQQIWAGGFKAYSGETRARCKGTLKLTCEATNRTEAVPGSPIPALVFRLRVTAAELAYSDLVVEHTLGLGGDAAKKLGDVAHGLTKRFKPDLEKNLLAKANAAVVKAADTKEVRVEFEKLLSGKNPVTKK